MSERTGRILQIPTEEDPTLKVEPVPTLGPGETMFLDWDAMTYVVVQGDQIPALGDDRLAFYFRLLANGDLTESEADLVRRIHTMREDPRGTLGDPDWLALRETTHTSLREKRLLQEIARLVQLRQTA